MDTHITNFKYALCCFNTVYFWQPPSGQSGHYRASQLVSVLAHQQTQGQQQRRLQRQLRLETGRCNMVDLVETKEVCSLETFNFTVLHFAFSLD